MEIDQTVAQMSQFSISFYQHFCCPLYWICQTRIWTANINVQYLFVIDAVVLTVMHVVTFFVVRLKLPSHFPKVVGFQVTWRATSHSLRGNTNKLLQRTDCQNPFTVAWEVKTSNRSRVRRDHPCCHRATWICKCGHARDAIMYAMWRRNLFGSSGTSRGRKLPFSTTLALHKPWQNGDDDDDDDDDDHDNDYCKKLNSLKQLVRTTVAESHNKNSKYQTATFWCLLF